MKCLALLFVLAAGSAAGQQPSVCGLKNVVFEAKLLSPLGTATAKPGDAFTAKVQSPEAFAGGTIEGSVKSLVKAERGFGKGAPQMDLEFNTLTYNNQTCSISGELKEVTNSKGQPKVDEEGRAVGHSSNKKRVGAAAAGAALGALGAVLAGGNAGTVIGAGAGGAVVGFLIVSKLTTTGTDIQFQPGAVFTVQASDLRKNESNGK